VLLEDAVRNRRLAIRLEGLGNLVDAEAGNPAAPATALRLARRLRLLRNLLRRESASLARERGPFPALDTAPIMAALSQRYGEATARRLIGRRLLRHRHLLAGSPLALLPDCNPRYPRAAYLNLLPALAGVDSLAMYGDSQDLSVTELARTLQLGWAVSVNRR